jgi:hypothetical protein
MGDTKLLVVIPMPSRDRDQDLLVPPTVVAPHARADADSDSTASATTWTSREVAALSSLFPNKKENPRSPTLVHLSPSPDSTRRSKLTRFDSCTPGPPASADSRDRLGLLSHGASQDSVHHCSTNVLGVRTPIWPCTLGGRPDLGVPYCGARCCSIRRRGGTSTVAGDEL